MPGKYKSEIEKINKKRNKNNKLLKSEEKTYEDLRDKNFTQDEITIAGGGGQGADFIAKNNQKLWVLEVKGSGYKWTDLKNVTFAHGAHVPARQIASSFKSKQADVVAKLQLPLHNRLKNESLVAVVTNMTETDALMAIICDKDDNIIAQHPVKLSEVEAFVNEYLPENKFNYDAIYDLIYDDNANLIVKKAGDAIVDDQNDFDFSEDDFGDVRQGIGCEWRDVSDKDVFLLECLEILYNIARMNNDHVILKTDNGTKNPDSTKKLSTIGDSKNLGIYLQPVRNFI